MKKYEVYMHDGEGGWRLEDEFESDSIRKAKLEASSSHPFSNLMLKTGDRELAYRINGHWKNAQLSDEWYTPPEFIEAAREVMGCIDLDPASNDYANKTVKAERYYTKDLNGLCLKWYGRVWLNPPYSRVLLPRFINKLLLEVSEGRVRQAIVLVNNTTETKPVNKLIASAKLVCFPAGRIHFMDEDGCIQNKSRCGQLFAYFGDHWEWFEEVFKKLGPVR